MYTEMQIVMHMSHSNIFVKVGNMSIHQCMQMQPETLPLLYFFIGIIHFSEITYYTVTPS